MEAEVLLVLLDGCLPEEQEKAKERESIKEKPYKTSPPNPQIP